MCIFAQHSLLFVSTISICSMLKAFVTFDFHKAKQFDMQVQKTPTAHGEIHLALPARGETSGCFWWRS
jgi:hypothetical protein